MSLNAQKLIAASGLAAFIGGVAGAFLTPYFAPIDLEFMGCGLPALARATCGGLAGTGVGFACGLPIAWLLPTPQERRR